MISHLSAAVAPGSPAGRWGGCAPHRRNSRPPEEGRAAGGPDPPAAAPLSRHSSPAHLPCSLPPPPRGLSAPEHKRTKPGQQDLSSTLLAIFDM